MQRWLATKFIFFPTKMIAFYPTEWQLKFEEVFFKNADGQVLHGWYFPGGAPNRTLIYYHGNAGNIGDRLPKIRKLYGIGMNIFLFDYRGYGGSEGRPSIDGLVADSLTAYRYVLSREDVDPNHIILYGESLGGAMALEVAVQERYKAIILEGTFTSVKEMAKSAYPFLPAMLAPDIYRNINLIRELHEPLLLLHGTEDRTVPYFMSEKLYQAAPQPKRFVSFEGCDHSNLHELKSQQYVQAIQEFLAQSGQ